MSIKPWEKYQPYALLPSAQYPYGGLKQESELGAGDGSPIDVDWGNDFEAFKQTAFSRSGLIPSGNADTVTNSEMFNAMQDIVSRNIWKRLAAEADYNLVSGSFEEGGTITSPQDVLWSKKNNKIYSGPNGTVPPNTTPSGSFVDRSLEVASQKIPQFASINYSAPSLPAITSKNKALFKPTSITDCLTWVVSRKSQGKSGWVATAISNEVAPSDTQNYGGASNYRPVYVINGASFFVGKTSIYAKTAGTVLSSLTSAQVNTVWGYTPNGAEYYAQSVGSVINWNTRQCYDCTGLGDSVTYNIAEGDCTVRLGMTNASSTLVKVQISFDGSNFVDYQTLSLRHPPSGSVYKRDVLVSVGATSPYFVRIENASTGSCLVAGINIGQLPEFGNVDIDNALFIQVLSVGGVPNQYQGGLGANEFAAKELSTGKFFGTYHGGHGGFLQRLRTQSATYNIDTTPLPNLLVVTSLQLHSVSTLTVSSTTYSFTCETFFGDGVNISTYAINLGSGSPIICERAYTHMCTTQRDFDWIHLPLTLNKTDDGDVDVGDCQFIQQFRSYDAAQLNCYFSGVNTTQNSKGGAYISFQPNYNKQYYGPALNSSSFQLTNGQFVTAKEYF